MWYNFINYVMSYSGRIREFFQWLGIFIFGLFAFSLLLLGTIK